MTLFTVVNGEFDNDNSVLLYLNRCATHASAYQM